MPAITEDWLREAGFKWHQLDRQPDKHWLLWLGDAINGVRGFTSFEDLGIELAPTWFTKEGEQPESWHCWLRSDAAGRYHRFIHVRHLKTTDELIALIEALTGQKWEPANVWYGSLKPPEIAKWLREEREKRLDRQLTLGAEPHAKWCEVEKDDTRGRALPEHLEAHAKGRSA